MNYSVHICTQGHYARGLGAKAVSRVISFESLTKVQYVGREILNGKCEPKCLFTIKRGLRI